MELTCIGHPFVDQDQAWPVLDEQLAQGIAGAGGLFVIGPNAGKGLGAPELPGQFPPEGAHHGPVGFGDRVAGRNPVAHQYHAPGSRKFQAPGLLHDRVDAGQLRGRNAGEQVIERQHGVGFAAAEIGLELYHRIPALA